MALGSVKVGCTYQINLLTIAHSTSRERSPRSLGAALPVSPSLVTGNSRRICCQSRLAPPFTLRRWMPSFANERARTGENLRNRGGPIWPYTGSSSVARTWNGLAATARSGGNLPTDSDTSSEYILNFESGDFNRRQAIASNDEEVTEVQLSGDDTEVKEIGESLYSVKTLKKLVFKLGDGGKQFVMNSVGGVVGILKMGKKEKEPDELIAFGASMYETKDGVSALHQWTATELTMQHNQLVRIATDLNYLIFAFAFFGWVRVLEAVVTAFSTNPPKLRKLTGASNAMDPLTVAWLAYNLRKPIIGILQVDPTDFQKLATLKGKLWAELHAFFERQWKVMATIAMVRFLGLIATNIPASQWVTNKVKLVWDILMALPIFLDSEYIELVDLLLNEQILLYSLSNRLQS